MGTAAILDPSLPKRIYRHWSFRIVLIVVLVLGIRTYQQHGVASGKAGPLAGADLQGKAVSLQELKGKTVLVYFWATWCGVCKVMADNVENVSRDHTVFTVASLSGSAEDVEEHLQEQGVSLPAVVDEEGALANAYGVHAYPTSFVVDRTGEIRFAEVGYTTEAGLRFRLWLADQW